MGFVFCGITPNLSFLGLSECGQGEQKALSILNTPTFLFWSFSQAVYRCRFPISRPGEPRGSEFLARNYACS